MRPDRWLPFCYDDGQGNGVKIKHWLPLNDPNRIVLDGQRVLKSAPKTPKKP